ncbi:hypothetical protein V1514DRAFT_275642 [Lipomyces japonicus]|uniref:uncharacterized protein n=1 Tax=Lipomyces japonicus TaxID=56871 RepID=UPI0034CF94EC
MSDSKLDIDDFLHDKPAIDPDNESEWLYLYRHQHSPFSYCNYCTQREDHAVFERQTQQIANQFVKILQWDPNLTFESVQRSAWEKAANYVEYLRSQSIKADEQMAWQEYELFKMPSLDEYTMARNIDQWVAEQVKQEWDKYLQRMNRKVKKKLARQKLKHAIIKLLRIRF